MPDIDFEESLRLKSTGKLYLLKDTFENIHEPWTWHGSKVVPGGLLMSECAATAINTISEGFVLDTIQAQFLKGASDEIPITYTVERISDGRRFAVRLVKATQKGKCIVSATVSFAAASSKSSPAMAHAVARETTATVHDITFDDLEPKGPNGPFMKFQRLPVFMPKTTYKPQNAIAISAAHISPTIPRPVGHITHVLGMINLSDYHVLDAPMQIYGLTFGLPAINDETRQPTEHQAKLFTSLNHSVYFHQHDGFRADEICYIEAKCPWATEGRALVQTNIFTRFGLLIASCVQEAFYVLKDDVDKSKL